MPDSRHSFSPRNVVVYAAFFAAMLIALSPERATAQAEHVEIAHPVYQFLSRMQVRGLVPEFSRSMLPLERKEVTALLRKLADDRGACSVAERALIDRFADEFVAEADGTQDAVLLFESPIAELPARTLSDREKFLYRWRSMDGGSTFAAELLAKLEYRTLM
ncbi:MAG: hypothetical protein WC824_15985, partial [Bacteroidota bacterium]